MPKTTELSSQKRQNIDGLRLHLRRALQQYPAPSLLLRAGINEFCSAQTLEKAFETNFGKRLKHKGALTAQCNYLAAALRYLEKSVPKMQQMPQPQPAQLQLEQLQQQIAMMKQQMLSMQQQMAMMQKQMAMMQQQQVTRKPEEVELPAHLRGEDCSNTAVPGAKRERPLGMFDNHEASAKRRATTGKTPPPSRSAAGKAAQSYTVLDGV